MRFVVICSSIVVDGFVPLEYCNIEWHVYNTTFSYFYYEVIIDFIYFGNGIKLRDISNPINVYVVTFETTLSSFQTTLHKYVFEMTSILSDASAFIRGAIEKIPVSKPNGPLRDLHP